MRPREFRGIACENLRIEVDKSPIYSKYYSTVAMDDGGQSESKQAV